MKHVVLVGSLLLLATAPAHAILEGANTSGDSAVVGLSFSGIEGQVCSGVVIDARIVLTSATCVKPAVDMNVVATGQIWVGSDETSATKIAVVDARYHRLWSEGMNEHDIAMVLVATDIGVTPAILSETVQPDSLVNMQVRAVGFGANRIEGDDYFGSGVKRSAPVSVKSIGARFILAGDDMGNVCKGDTGGPLFYTEGGVERVVAIAGNTQFCSIATAKALVDAYLEDFIWPAMDAWVGACPKDGMCTTVGCRTEDPDCNACGLDDTCMMDCPKPDWDCAPDALFRQPCVEDLDCDSRLCVAAPDEPRIKFCSEDCAGELADRICGDGMECQSERCVFRSPTPGSQGAPCGVGGDCRSGFCHPAMVCVEPCADEGATCGNDYVCRASELAPLVCAPRPRDAGLGFCQVQTGAAPEPSTRGALILAFALCAAVLTAMRRRA